MRGTPHGKREFTARLKENGISCQAFNGANASAFIGRDGIRFVNRRAEAWWHMREELNPDREGGSAIALPEDPELLADLSSPTFEITRAGVKIEPKDDIKKRLGRSPDKGDAVVMCLAPGYQAIKREQRSLGMVDQEQAQAWRKPLKVKLGYAGAKRGKP